MTPMMAMRGQKKLHAETRRRGEENRRAVRAPGKANQRDSVAVKRRNFHCHTDSVVKLFFLRFARLSAAPRLRVKTFSVPFSRFRE